MLSTRVFSNLRLIKRCPCMIPTILNGKRFSSNKNKKTDVNFNKPSNLGDMASKYQPFSDTEPLEILDMEEELKKINQKNDGRVDDNEPEDDVFNGINLQRGHSGVFEIEDLVDVLHRANAEDIFVAAVPKEINYVNYICIVTGMSRTHMKSLTQFVVKVFKMKMSKTDTVPRVEGPNSKDWMALDLGNIALHVFSRSAREVYDLDTLWSVGPKFDREYNKQDEITDMLEKHTIYLQNLNPAS